MAITRRVTVSRPTLVAPVVVAVANEAAQVAAVVAPRRPRQSNPHIPSFNVDTLSTAQVQELKRRLSLAVYPRKQPKWATDPAPGEVNRVNVELPAELVPFRWVKHHAGPPSQPADLTYYAWHWALVDKVEALIWEQQQAANAASAPPAGPAERDVTAVAAAQAVSTTSAIVSEIPAPAVAPTARPVARLVDSISTVLPASDADLAAAVGQPSSALTRAAPPVSTPALVTSPFRPRGVVATSKRPANAPPTTSSEGVAPALLAFYAVGDQGVMIHGPTLATISYRDFQVHYAGLLPNQYLPSLLGMAAFEANHCVSSRFAPGMPQTFEQDGERFFNTYRPVNFEPVTGSTEPLERMLTRLLDGDLNSVAVVVNILAFLVQNPGQRLRYIPCFVTRASFNKELLGHLLVTLLGDKNTYVPDAQAFSGQFADWLLRTSTVLLNHVQTSKAFQDRMVYLLTAPELSVLLKGKNSTQVPNVLNQVAFARELGDLEHFADPRRLGIFEMSETPVTSEEYAAFKAWLDGNGKAHALHALLHHDLAGAGFDPQQAPSNLVAQGQLDALSRSPVQDYLQEALVSVSSPLALDLVNVNDITRALLGEGHRVTNADVLKALKELGAVRLGQIRNVEGQEGKPNYWAVRRQAFWSSQSEGARRAYLEEAAQGRLQAGPG